MFDGRKITMVLALALALPMAACDDPTGPDGATSIVLSADDGVSAALVASMAPTGFEASAVDLALVEEIRVSITRVDVLPQGGAEGENGDGAWISLAVTAPATIDLMSLSNEGIQIAEGELDAGTYGSVRLFFDDATIRFSEDVTLGATTKEGGRPHELFIPSAAQTGVKVLGVSFTVGDDAESGPVTIEFDDAGSVQTVTLAASIIIMSPVLTQAE